MVIDHQDPASHQSQILRFGQSPLIVSLCYDSFALWLFGQPDTALLRVDAARAMAEDIGHNFSLAYAMFAKALVHQFRQEPEAVLEAASAIITLSEQKEFPYFLVLAKFFETYALIQLGQTDLTVTDLSDAFDAFETTGSKANGTYYLAMMAEAYIAAGQLEQGLRTIEKALLTVQQTGELVWNAELLRLKTVLLQRSGDGDGQVTDELLWSSIDIARRQGSHSLELKSLISLYNFSLSDVVADRVKSDLERCCLRFTEGLDSTDLQSASQIIRRQS